LTDWTLADEPSPEDGIDRTSDSPIVQVVDGEVIYRASSVGSCLRKLWAARSGYQAAPTPEKMQAAYDRGHEAEPKILAALEARGWELRNRQGEVFFQVYTTQSGTVISVIGHYDCEARLPNTVLWLPCDVKNFGPAFVSEYKSHGISNKPHYQWQQSIYVMGHDTARQYLMPVWDYENEDFVASSLYPLDPPFTLPDLEVRLHGIEKLYAESVEPPCTLEYPCPYWKLHDKKVQSEIPEAAKVLITARQNADAKIKFWSGLKDTMTDEILKVLGDNVGEFSCTWEGHQITVQANSDKFNTNHAKELLKEAGFDLEDPEFKIPGKGVKLVITTSKGH
jgi:hypothetical protein